MFQIYSWPNIILHIDGDAFFASVIQAINPSLKGKPVVTGQERGIATAISYEAKKYGVKRGMRMFEIRKICPNCIIVNSDYEVYGLFSQKMFNILKTFSPTIEEYSIDEGFADLKGLLTPFRRNLLGKERTPVEDFHLPAMLRKAMQAGSPTCDDEFLNEQDSLALGGNKNFYANKQTKSYELLGQTIKEKVESSLGITVSIGISLTKSLAKLASNFHKPSGLTVVGGREIESFLKEIKINDVWGIGPQTSAYLKKFNINTAFDFASLPESFIQKNLTKPFFEIWQELRGKMVYTLNSNPKTTYRSVTRSRTFTPPSSDKNFLYAQLLHHIEEAFFQVRHLNYSVGRFFIYLKTQQFKYYATEIKLTNKTAYPLLIRDEIRNAFDKIYKNNVLYRTTGCTLTDLRDIATQQPQLFQNFSFEEKVKKVYPLLDEKKVDFGSSLFDKRLVAKKKEPPKFKLPFLEFNI